jgi:predicted secreted protein
VRLTSIIAIYILFFAAASFVMLPFGVKTDEEAGTAKVPGQADSAPHQFNLKRHLLKGALFGGLLTALYVANYVYGWLTPEMLDFYSRD